MTGAQQLSCSSQRLSCGAQGYPAVHNSYPGLTGVGASDTCVSKKREKVILASQDTKTMMTMMTMETMMTLMNMMTKITMKIDDRG